MQTLEKINDFDLTDKLHESANSLLYRGLGNQDHQEVMIKVLKADYPSEEEIARFKFEYEVLKNLKGQGTVKAYGFFPCGNGFAIIMEDYHYDTVYKLLKKNISIKEFLEIAIAICDALDAIHRHQVIHQDISPYNILYDAKNNKAKIIDFGHASLLEHEDASLQHSEIMPGTLPYVAPELTGRMNRKIDYRADYYSLGVVFYQMLTSELPFKSEDPLELMHCHLAVLPKPPSEINAAIPSIVSDIILKLLSKEAENRYQSLYGLKADLKHCLRELKTQQTIEAFTLGSKDISSVFHIDETLYGREEEVAILLSTFEKVSTGTSQFMLISGQPGVGKSRLINEIQKSLVKKRGYFISGKFDQYTRNIPYAALLQALRELIATILMESEEKINFYRERIRAAIGANGQLILDIFPELSEIIGEQPAVLELNPVESQNRFNNLFQNFMNALVTKEHPLVMFLDDLQWIDLYSLKLLEVLLSNQECNGLFLIGAYRNNEVDLHHPLLNLISNAEKNGNQIIIINLGPLQLEHVEQLVANTLHRSITEVRSIADICYKKTQGNPFFLTQFLQTLYLEKLIWFNSSVGKWEWNNDEINKARYTDNVVEFMVQKLSEFNPSTRNALQLAACLGNRFDLDMLAAVSQKGIDQLVKDLWPALRTELIIPIDDSYKMATYFDKKQNKKTYYQFLHDRVQQAAYCMIDKNNLDELHLKIGRLLLNKYTTLDEQEKNIFEIAKHINKGIDLVKNAEEKIYFAKINLMAGKKAKTALAYQVALTFFKSAMNFIGNAGFKHHYALTLDVYQEAAEAAFLASENHEMKQYVDIVLAKGKNILDKIKAYEIQTGFYSTQGKYDDVISSCIKTLSLLGVPIPTHFLKFHLLIALIRNRYLLRGNTLQNFKNYPRMTDPYLLKAQRILTYMSSAIVIRGQWDLIALTSLKGIEISVKYGISAQAAYGLCGYSLMLCDKLNDPKKAYEIGQTFLQIVDIYPEAYIRTVSVFYSFVVPLTHHFNKSLQPLDDTFIRALNLGEFEVAGYISTMCLNIVFCMGTNLTECAQKAENLATSLAKVKEKIGLQWTIVFWNFWLELMGQQEKYASHPLMKIYEKDVLQKAIERSDFTGLLYFYGLKLISVYLLGDNEEVLYEYLQKAITYSEKYNPFPITSSVWFYSALASLQMYSNADRKKQLYFLDVASRAAKLLKKRAKTAPMNFLHCYYLVLAELASIKGKYAQAKKYYNKAIKLAHEYGFIQIEATAHELAAKYYLKMGEEKIAKLYMKDACYLYLRWGANAKVKKLAEQYSNWINETALSDELEWNDILRSPSIKASGKMFDFASVMKSAENISKEIELDLLLKNLLNIVVENAGAQKACIILKTKDEWWIEAKVDPQGEMVVLQSLPLTNNLPMSVIKKVLQTKEIVLLDNATSSTQFANDPYIHSTEAKSILCMPLMIQNNLKGVLYLENNLLSNVFNKDRVELLKLLTGQIVISIENARIYQAYVRFIPQQFLSLLNKGGLINIMPGDHIQAEMTIVFSDLRSFTSLSEKMSPQETFKFLNTYLKYMGPVLTKHHGFVDKYLGDGILAIFPHTNNAEDALSAAIDIMKRLDLYNIEAATLHKTKLSMGVGINTGLVILGTVGDEHRMDGTVISDAVNLSSRVQSLTKKYGAPILITQETYSRLKNPDQFAIRKIAKAKIRGKKRGVILYEIMDADPPDVLELKKSYLDEFNLALSCYYKHDDEKALALFTAIVDKNPNDNVAVFWKNEIMNKLNSSHEDIVKTE